MAISLLDWGVLFIYGLALVCMVLYFSRKTHAQDDYFLAGRNMSRWPIAISMYVALFSTNSMLGVTGWVNRPHGTVWIGLQNVGTIMAVPLVVMLYPKIFFRLKITTAYEYVEKRFNYPVRAFGTLFFMVSRTMWLSIVIYSAGLVVSRMLGWGHGSAGGQIRAMLTLGAAATLFALIGGMRGVIWTDVLQFFVLLSGVLSVAIIACMKAGGLTHVWHLGVMEGKLAPPAFFSLHGDLTIVSGLALGVFAYLSSAGADQVLLQTYLTAKSESEARKSIIRSGAFLKPLSLIFPFLGLLLFGYYRAHPETAALMRIPDDALPVFVIYVLPAGIRGLMIAAILSAVMTTVCSGLTALSACVQVDFIKRWKRSPISDRGSVFLARTLVFSWGVLVCISAIFVMRIGQTNNIIQILNLLMYPFSGVLLGIFLLGLLTHRANSAGAGLGAVVGFAGTIGAPLLQRFLNGPGAGVRLPASAIAGISWLAGISNFYYAAIGAILTVAIGYGVSWCLPRPPLERLAGLTHNFPAYPARESSEGNILTLSTKDT
ncbi:MAG TPA: sodium/solute symporter [Terriglobales bacterium]|nr:sodium/solute symporter [Terriglobales bacterium]